jgi:hypothetical protein
MRQTRVQDQINTIEARLRGLPSNARVGPAPPARVRARAGVSGDGTWLPYAVRVSDHNPNIPDNLYLMIGGPFGDCLQW